MKAHLLRRGGPSLLRLLRALPGRLLREHGSELRVVGLAQVRRNCEAARRLLPGLR